MALTSWHAQSLNDRQFFFAALRNYVGEVIFFGIVTFVLWLVSQYVWWLAIVLFIPFSFLMAVSFIQSLILIPGAASALTTDRFIRKHGTDEEKKLIVGNGNPSDQLFAFGTAVIGLLKSIICVGFTIWLAFVLFRS